MGEKNPPLSSKTRTRPLEAQLADSALVPHQPITSISSCSRGRCPRPTPAWAAALGPALSACGYMLAQLCSNPLSPGLRWLTSVWSVHTKHVGTGQNIPSASRRRGPVHGHSLSPFCGRRRDPKCGGPWRAMSAKHGQVQTQAESGKPSSELSPLASFCVCVWGWGWGWGRGEMVKRARP